MKIKKKSKFYTDEILNNSFLLLSYVLNKMNNKNYIILFRCKIRAFNFYTIQNIGIWKKKEEE